MWQKLDQVLQVSAFAILGAFFGIVRIAMSNEPKSIKTYLFSFCVSAVVGFLAGNLSLSFFPNYAVAMFFSSIGSLLSREIIMGIIENKGFLSGLVKQALTNLTDKFTK